MSLSKQRAIASKGGRAAHAKGTAYEFTSEEARIAGRKRWRGSQEKRAHLGHRAPCEETQEARTVKAHFD
jgi:hypothetical protein